MSKKEKKIERIELTMDDLDFDAVNAISLVEFPAIEEDFFYFSDNKEKLTLAKVDKEKRIITGPALIPNKDILRFNYVTGEEFNVWFSEKTVETIAYKYMYDMKTKNVTLDHNQNVNNVSVVENWIVNNPNNDKSNELGYKLNKGTWMISMKIENDEIWEKYIKEEKVKGFSIEGWFSQKFENSAEKEPEIEHDIIECEDEELDLIKEMIDLETIISTDDDDDTDKKYFVKQWQNVKSDVGPCPFCSQLEGEKVPYGSLWQNPRGKWQKYTKLKPKQVHHGCKCKWKRVEVSQKEYEKILSKGQVPFTIKPFPPKK